MNTKSTSVCVCVSVCPRVCEYNIRVNEYEVYECVCVSVCPRVCEYNIRVNEYEVYECVCVTGTGLNGITH